MYKPDIDMMQVLPENVTEASYKIRSYLEQWRPLFIKKLGMENIDEALSSTFLHTLQNFKDFSNDEHLSRYIKKVATTYNSRTATQTVEYEDYLVDTNTIEDSLILDTAASEMVALILSHAKDIKSLDNLLSSKPTHKKPSDIAFTFRDESLKSDIQEKLLEGNLTVGYLLDLMHSLSCYTTVLAKGVKDTAYDKRITLKGMDPLNLDGLTYVDVSEPLQTIKAGLTTGVLQDLTHQEHLLCDRVSVRGKCYYIAKNGRVSVKEEEWLKHYAEILAYDISKVLSSTHKLEGYLYPHLYYSQKRVVKTPKTNLKVTLNKVDYNLSVKVAGRLDA